MTLDPIPVSGLKIRLNRPRHLGNGPGTPEPQGGVEVPEKFQVIGQETWHQKLFADPFFASLTHMLSKRFVPQQRKHALGALLHVVDQEAGLPIYNLQADPTAISSDHRGTLP